MARLNEWAKWGVLVALAVASIVLVLAWDSPNSPAPAVVLALTFVAIVWYSLETRDLRIATREMAEATKEQAEASRKMAEAMERQRMAAARPVLSITPEHEGSYGSPARWQLNVVLRNVGVGPAINVLFDCELPGGPGAAGDSYARNEFGALGVGDSQKVPFEVRPQDLQPGSSFARSLEDSHLIRLVCDYEDIYGSPFSSWLEISTTDQITLTVGRLLLVTSKTSRLWEPSSTGL